MARTRRVALAAAVLVALGLFVAPRDWLPRPGRLALGGVPADAAVHLAVCLLVGGVWAWARPRASLRQACLAGLAFAAGAELVQALPGVARGATLADGAWNLVGFAAGWVGMRSAHRP